MNVSMPGRPPASGEIAGGPIPQRGKEMSRRMPGAEGLRILFFGSDVDPKDAALFRALLADAGERPRTMAFDGAEARVAAELAGGHLDRQDEVARIVARHGSIDERQTDVQETAPAASVDLVALGGIVAKVYLETLHDGGRAISMALENDLLPATRLSVLEQEGRLAVDFVSVHPLSRERLRRGAPALAERISRELSRDVSVKVAAHDDDRLALEVRADAFPATPPSEPV